MADTLDIDDGIEIPLDELVFTAVRSQGAGGQNVNKVATAIHLRFDFENSAVLNETICERIRNLDDHRVTAKGIVIKAQEHRTQTRNKQAAMGRLQTLVRSVLIEPKKRLPTKVSRAAKKKRVENKRRKSQIKKTRGRIGNDD